jgi:hypothetical protein
VEIQNQIKQYELKTGIKNNKKEVSDEN